MQENEITKDERIAILEKKVAKLEAKERRRTIRAAIAIGFRLIILVALVFVGYKVYVHVNETIIKPYQETVEKVNQIEEKATSITEKASSLFGN